MFRRRIARAQARERLSARVQDAEAEWARQYRAGTLAGVVADFVRTRLCAYAGLDSSQVLPDDELRGDLGFPATAYPDWELDLSEEFESAFRAPLPVRNLPADLLTVKDWIDFLLVCTGSAQTRR